MYNGGSELNEAVNSAYQRVKPRIHIWNALMLGNPNGRLYTVRDDELVSLSHESRSNAGDRFSIGCVCSARIEFKIRVYVDHVDPISGILSRNKDDFPLHILTSSTSNNLMYGNVVILDYVYTTDNGEISIPAGLFYLDSISDNNDGETITVVAYDLNSRRSHISTWQSRNYNISLDQPFILRDVEAVNADVKYYTSPSGGTGWTFLRNTTYFNKDLFATWMRSKAFSYPQYYGISLSMSINAPAWPPYNLDGRAEDHMKQSGLDSIFDSYLTYRQLYEYFALYRGGYAYVQRPDATLSNPRTVEFKRYASMINFIDSTSSTKYNNAKLIEMNRTFSLELSDEYYYITGVNIKTRLANYNEILYEPTTQNTIPRTYVVPENKEANSKYMESQKGCTLTYTNDLFPITTSSTTHVQRPTTYLDGVVFKAGKVKILGDPRIDPGDIVEIRYERGGLPIKDYMYAMKILHEYDGGLTTTIECFEPGD